jgi:ribosomal protein S10
MYTLQIIFQTHKPKNFEKLSIFIKQQQISFRFLKLLKITKKVTLKNKIKNFTVLKSPHVNKKSREHFQYKKHKCLLVVKSTNSLPLFYFNFLITNFLNRDFLISSKIVFIA